MCPEWPWLGVWPTVLGWAACLPLPRTLALLALTPSGLVDLVLGTFGFAIKIFTYLLYGDEILNIYFLMKTITRTP